MVDDYSVPPWNMMFSHMTSMVDWCEPNYMLTPHVAEPANTASNVPFYTYALLLVMLFKSYSRHFGKGNIIVWFFLLTVGICSTIFHATLSFGGQLLDQVSILWLIMVASSLWIPQRLLPVFCRNKPNVTRLFFFIWTVIISTFAWINSTVYAIVIGILGIPITLILLCEMHRTDSQRALKLGFRVLLISFLAGACWMIDRFLCETWLGNEFPYFHALWHFLSAVAASNLLVLFAYFDAASRLAGHSDLMPLLSYWPNDNTTWECLSVPYVVIAYRSVVKKRLILPM